MTGVSLEDNSILPSSKGQTTQVMNSTSMRNSSIAKLKFEDIDKLEKKCQRMIYEKEEKYLENE